MFRRGVRYYRAVPPPESEWAPDYAAMASHGFDLVVIPVPWALSHVGDESFDFSPLLRQLDLADDNGLRVEATLDLAVAPAWLTSRHPEWLHEDAWGKKALPGVSYERTCVGWPGVCFDNEPARSLAERFLGALASAAAGHPSLAGYDVSGCSALAELVCQEPEALYCQCPASRASFVAWLRRGYGDELDALGRAWSQRFGRWEDVTPPAFHGQFCINLDWRRFQRESAAAHLLWCMDTLRASDRATPVTSPSAPMGFPALADTAERPRRVTLSTHDRASLRRDHWDVLAAPPEAVVYVGWRPEHLAWLAQPALALPNGEPGGTLREADWLANLLERNPDLAAARRCPAEAAVGLVQETQDFWCAMEVYRHYYQSALDGARAAFAGHGTQVDLARPEALGAYPLVYLPQATVVSQGTAEALRRYVEGGGRLVAEAGLASVDERGTAARVSPALGLDEVFGARALDEAKLVLEKRPQSFKGRHGSFPCYGEWRPLEATTGIVKARFTDGAAAIVDNAFGAGATRLIGTVPSLGYENKHEKSHARVILDSLAFAKIRPRVVTSSPDVCVRLLSGEGGAWFLVAFSTSEAAQEATLRVSRAVAHFRRADDLVTGKRLRLHNNARRIKLNPNEGIVLRLDASSRRPRWRSRRRGAGE